MGKILLTAIGVACVTKSGAALLFTFDPFSISGVQNCEYDRSSDATVERHFRVHIMR
jgi:hypothetical protein